jgi:hypothetical protein
MVPSLCAVPSPSRGAPCKILTASKCRGPRPNTVPNREIYTRWPALRRRQDVAELKTRFASLLEWRTVPRIGTMSGWNG